MESKKKLKNWYFSKGIRSMVFLKNLKFFHHFIFGKISQQKVFDDILEGKKAFLYSKMKKLKSQRIGIFPKRLIHMVLVKNFNFSMFFIFGKINQQNVFDVILESQKAFLDYKKQKVKKSKNQDFSKGVGPWFC